MSYYGLFINPDENLEKNFVETTNRYFTSQIINSGIGEFFKQSSTFIIPNVQKDDVIELSMCETMQFSNIKNNTMCITTLAEVYGKSRLVFEFSLCSHIF